MSMGLLAMTERACSQDDQKASSKKPLNNPMYSTHNYKHPNLAAAASRWDKKEGVAVKKPSPGDAQLANYKNQMPNVEPLGGITVDHSPSTNLADRNYKIQRLSEPQSTGFTNEYYVKKQNKKKSDTTATGE